VPKSYKVLGQVLPATANTETTLYTVPAATQAVVSTITIANVTSGSVTARVNIRPAGAAVAALHALVRDASVAPNSTMTMTLGITLGATDVISVQSGTVSALTFHAYGTEITA
jgi:hypothetical protein